MDRESQTQQTETRRVVERSILWLLVLLIMLAASCSVDAPVDEQGSASGFADAPAEDSAADLEVATPMSSASAGDPNTLASSIPPSMTDAEDRVDALIDGWSGVGNLDQQTLSSEPDPATTAPDTSSVGPLTESDGGSVAVAGDDGAGASISAEEILGVADNPSATGGLIGADGDGSCVAPPTGALTTPPEWVTTSLQAAVDHPDFDGLDVSVSVWIDGWGEVVTRDPDLALLPASNEKILVAHAANELIEPTSTIETSIESVGGDLVFRAGGDPSFTTWRADQLVAQVVEAGITNADQLIIDVSDFPQPSAASGWQSWQIRYFVGPLSGFVLDDNRWNVTEEFLETPALINGEWLADRLRIAGVSISSVAVVSTPDGRPADGRVIATTESSPIGTMVRNMMLVSDNQTADLLTMQLGLLNGTGTLQDGIAQIDAELAELCVPLSGVMDDGSGLSRGNFRSAREFQQILRAIRETETAAVFRDQLPIGGVSGTLRGRFGGDAGRVLAKTGTIFGGRALSGYATTDSGRDVVFSILINGERERTSSSLGALDALVRTILRS